MRAFKFIVLIAVAVLTSGCTADVPGATPDESTGAGGEKDARVADPPARLEVTSVLLSKARVEPSETFRVTVAVRNTGGQTGVGTVAVTSDGARVASASVSVAPGGAERAEISVSLSAPGDHAIAAEISGGITMASSSVVHVMYPARFVAQRIVANPATVELGDSVAAAVTVSNEGEMSGSGTVTLFADGRSAGTGRVSLAGGSAQDTTITFTPAAGGRVTLEAVVGDSRTSTAVVVKAPRLADPQWTYDDLWCQDSVPLRVTFTNGGDGVARQVKVRAVIYNENDVAQDEKQTIVGNVAAGGSAQANLVLFARDTCGRDDYYRVSVSIAPEHGAPLDFRTERFSI